MNELISVIVPAYNAEDYIGKCLDSILNQSYKELEIIVIDDGSTDSTGKIIDQYALSDNRICVIHQKNKGLVESREVGIINASGSYIAFVDSDDTICFNLYEKLFHNLKKYNADISHCGVSFCWPDGKVEEHYGTGKIKLQNKIEGIKDLLDGEFVEPALWNKLYKKELLYNSCLDKSVLNNEDLLRNFIIFKRAKLSVYEDFCGYQYMQRVGSMSKNEQKKFTSIKHILNARKLILDNSNKEEYAYALKLWLSTNINVINEFTFNNDDESKALCKASLKVLRENKSNFHLLIKRQQLAAKLILISPFLHRIIYKIYERGKRND